MQQRSNERSPSSFFASLLFVFTLIGFSGCGSSDSPQAPAPVVEVPPVEAPSPPQPAPPPQTTTDANGTTCGQVELTRRPLFFCYRDPSGQGVSARPTIDVVYFFHGLGGGPDDLFSGNGRLILDGLTRLWGADMPILVSLSLGPAGVMGDEAVEVVFSGLTAIEGVAAPGKTVERVAMGGSLGGHNTLRMVAGGPDQFDAAAALCPALSTINGHDEAGVAAYVQRHSAILDRDFFFQALALFKQELPTPEIWEANQPFAFLDRGAYDGMPIFLSVGREDTLGFVEGSREFKRRADLRPNASVEYWEVRGPHCVFEVPAFLRFMDRNVRAGAATAP